jgi:hypothetical protein
MNMQTIQVFFLLFDNIIKLAPWRMVTDKMIGKDFEAGPANLKRLTES